MNKRDQLLTETLGGEGENFARLAAAHARRRRAMRRLGLAAIPPAVLILAVLLVRPSPTTRLPAPAAPRPEPAFEVISDAELLAELKDQPVLVIKDQKGITGIIFLAQEAKL